MKNLLKVSFIALFGLLSGNIYAIERDFAVKFENVSNKTLKFEVTNAQNVSLFVYNEKNGILYSEKTGNAETVEKSYNFEDVDAGNYYLVAESNQKIAKYKINVVDNNVVVDKTPISVIYKPEYTMSGNHVQMKMDNIDNEKFYVTVYDKNNEYYSKDITPKDGKFVMDFDFNPANIDNTYYISVDYKGNYFNQVISLKK